MQDGFLADKSKYHGEAQRDVQAALGIVIGAAVLLYGAMMVPRAVEIGFDLGTPGTYVVRDEPDCSRENFCSTRTGTFTSDDGKVVRTDVHVRNRLPKPVKQGDRIRAFDIGDDHEVFTDEGNRRYPVGLPFMLSPIGLVVLVMAVRYFLRKRKRSGAT
jgi:hypothetical protein